MAVGTLDVVHVGSASRDLVDDDPRGWRLGGGATYSALTSARLGLRTGAVVGVDPLASSAEELDLLRSADVALSLVPLEEGPVFVNRETSGGRVQTSAAAGRPVPAFALPAEWRDTACWSLVPVAGELDDSWLTNLPSRAFVSLGWQGLLRALEAGRRVQRLPPGPSRLVARADLVGVSRHDLVPGVRPRELLALLHPGARLVVTDGLNGGQMLHRTDEGKMSTRRYAAVRTGAEIDPTGAGDVFLAALLASAIRAPSTEAPAERPANFDLAFAATAASFVVEAPGLHGVPVLDAVLARLGQD